MQLTEFDLDLPYIANEENIKLIMKDKNCSQNEATKIDYEQNWKDKRGTFRLETRCITAMFERLFGKMKTDNCWKVLVECVGEIKEQKVQNFSGVLTIQVKFDYEKFSGSNEYQKKQMTLSTLFEGLKIVAKEKEWSMESFEVVYSQIQNNDYSNEWIWKKPVKSHDKKFTAEVLCQHGIKYMDISIILRDKKGNELVRKKAISEFPDEFAYAKHLGELKWISSSEVALVNKKGDNSLNISFELAT